MQYSNILTKEETKEMIAKTNSLISWSHFETDDYFFTDSYLAPTKEINDDDNWSSCSYRFTKHQYGTKEIKTLEDYLMVFYPNSKEYSHEESSKQLEYDQYLDNIDEAIIFVN